MLLFVFRGTDLKQVGAGLALHEVWQLTSNDGEHWDICRSRRQEVRGRLKALVFEVRTLQLEPQAFSARFWRTFYRAMLSHTIRNAMTKLLIAALAVFIASQSKALAQTHTNMVIAVDLTKSVAVKGADGKSEFQKNVEAVTKLLAQVPADSQITIIGITDHSFSQPDILLSARISSDTGYLGERLTAARVQLVRIWKTRSATLQPRYRSTDIIGALLLSSQLFGQQSGPARRALLIYSDMRQRTRSIDLETPSFSPGTAKLAKNAIFEVSLRNVEVSALGVEDVGTSITYWERLRSFWTDFLLEQGAVLKEYSVLRDLGE